MGDARVREKDFKLHTWFATDAGVRRANRGYADPGAAIGSVF